MREPAGAEQAEGAQSAVLCHVEWGGRASLAYFIKRLFLLGDLDVVAVADGDGQTLFPKWQFAASAGERPIG